MESTTPKNDYITSRNNLGGITWEQVRRMPVIRLYAGDVPKKKEYKGMIGLSLTRNDQNHLQHDITRPFPLENNSVDSFQAEDVLEHISYEKIIPIVNEVHRILKPGGLFRLSVPDYGCDVLKNRSVKDEKGQIIYDPGGGGTPENPGHVWFPRIDTVMKLLTETKFHSSGKIELLHYYNMDGTFVAKPIDYSKGHIIRTPDFDERVKNPYRPMSLVTDLTKNGGMLCETKNKSRNPEGLIKMQEQSVIKTEPVEKCRRAHVLMEEGHVLKALERFDKILACSPDFSNARLGRVICLARLGRLLEAEVEAGTLRNQNRHSQQFQQLYEHIRNLKQTLTGERDIEWDFIKRQLVKMVKVKGRGVKILDFGCGHTAVLTRFAANIGFQVTAVDMVPLTVSIENFPNVRFIQADFLKHDWSGQSFDLIINCSSIEHAGLAGRYGVVENRSEDDLEIMAQMTRLLKHDGCMLLTVPVGKDTVVGSLHRVYGQKRLPELLKGWDVESSYFWMKDENDTYRPVDEESALQREPMLAYSLGCFVLQPIPLIDQTLIIKDAPEPVEKKTRSEPAVSQLEKFQNIEKNDKRLKMQVIGTEYGGWAVDLDLIPFGSTIISAGVGEDISFDSGLINLKNCTVIAIDPTEKAKRYVENNKHENFSFLQKALYSESNKKIRIYKNANPDYVSESITPSHQSVSGADFYEAETISIQDLLNNYKNVSVLKMDIEGAEYEVLNSINKLEIPQICIEFHHFCTDFTTDDTEKCIEHLQRMGYVSAYSKSGYGAVKEATFVNQKYLSNRNTAKMYIDKAKSTNSTSDMSQITLPNEDPSDRRRRTHIIGTKQSSWASGLEDRKCRELTNNNIAGGYRCIYLFHIRKTGGTSLNHIFLSQSGEKSEEVYKRLSEAKNHRVISNDKVFVGWNKTLIEQGSYHYAFSHLFKHQFRLPKGTFTITCLRDPVKRILSHYKMLLEFKVNNIAHPCMKIEGKWLGKTFDDFLKNIPKEHLLNQLYMFSKNFNVNEAFDNIMSCSHFFFTEQFSLGVSQLSTKLGIELKPIHIRKTSIKVNFSRMEIDRLRTMLDEEYLLHDKLKRAQKNVFDGYKVLSTQECM